MFRTTQSGSIGQQLQNSTWSCLCKTYEGLLKHSRYPLFNRPKYLLVKARPHWLGCERGSMFVWRRADSEKCVCVLWDRMQQTSSSRLMLQNHTCLLNIYVVIYFLWRCAVGNNLDQSPCELEACGLHGDNSRGPTGFWPLHLRI